MGMLAPKAPEPNDEKQLIVVIFVIQGMCLPPTQILA